MKNFNKLLIVILLFVFTFSTNNICADYDNIKVILNGELVMFDDVTPIIKNSRTLVPMRAIFEKLGITLKWEQETKTVIGEKEGLIIKLSIGNDIAYKNNEEIKLDVPATIINGRTMVPLRFISESVGLIVGWEESTKTVSLTNDDKNIVSNIEVKLNNTENNLLKLEEEYKQLFDENEINIVEEKLLKLEIEIRNKFEEYVFNNGDIVYGEFKNGDIYGKAVYIWNDGDKYIGDFINGDRTGEGAYYWSNGDKYIGQFEDGFKMGQGGLIWEDGTKYIGEFVDDFEVGKGRYYWPDGDKYFGEFTRDNNKIKGVYYWNDGDKYIGDFIDGIRTGEGVYYWNNGDKYIGDFKEDNLTGKGMYYYSNGDRTPYGDFIEGEYIDEYYGLKYSEIVFEPKTNQNTLVVLVDFYNIKVKNSDDKWNKLLFDANSKSVNDYYNEISKGKISFSPANESYGLENDGVVKVSLDYNHPNVSIEDDSLEKVTYDALTKTNEYIDFNEFDENNNGSLEENELNIILVLAGYDLEEGPINRPGVRAHQSKLYKYPLILDNVKMNSYIQVSDMIYEENYGEYMSTIGTISHELGHNLGLPDLYDTDESSLGVGVHSLMGGGNHTYIGNEEIGSTPVHLDPWSKIKLGIIEPEIINESGEYLVYSSSNENYNIIKIPTINENEYFLIENRQFNGYDSSLNTYIKNGGISIWHVNENVIDKYYWDNIINDNEEKKGVELKEANEEKLGYSQLDSNIYSTQNKLYDHYYYKGGNEQFSTIIIPNEDLNNSSNSSIKIKVLQNGDPMKIYIEIN